MATGATNYQCPACTAPLHFSAASGKLECDYCGGIYEVEQIEQMYAAKDAAAAAAQETIDRKKAEQAAEMQAMGLEWSGEESAGMKTYSCPSCRAELICDATTAATSCPYCGNNTIIPGQFSGGLRPDLVIPFKLDKEAAKTALKNFYKGKKFLPGAFTKQNHIEEIKGVYVPFWLCDCTVEGTARYAAERSLTYDVGDERITETDHFEVLREGWLKMEKIPADASTKMPDEYMDAIEPYDYAELKEFSPAYLPGFLADKYDVPQQESMTRIEARAKTSIGNAFYGSASGFDSIAPEEEDYRLTDPVMRYALLPVWLLSTRWNKKSYLFAMNGQTGKLVGDLPVSKGKYWAWFAGIAASVTALLLLVLL
ncbi:MAG: hypothetical protein IJ412_02920 [Oscillospiraceae bacterium]|nr:hypothetical protein [Oscillospiraceae bacterium]